MKMNFSETISRGCSSILRKNGPETLQMDIMQKKGVNCYVINGEDLLKFEEKDVLYFTMTINPKTYYMIYNISNSDLAVAYSHDPSLDEIIYDPYKYVHSDKVNIDLEEIKKFYDIPDEYIDTLPKWYSFKFTYEKYNLIFIKPNMGISWQLHKKRNEFWEILGGNPIIINKNKIHYFVKEHKKFEIPIGTIHSVINPNKNKDEWVIIRENWNGDFDEMDIKRIFNPNQYF